MRVYLDNAATTPLDPEVVSAMTDVLSNCYGNPSAQHAIGRNAKGVMEMARLKIAELINADGVDYLPIEETTKAMGGTIDDFYWYPFGGPHPIRGKQNVFPKMKKILLSSALKHHF